jgi:Zn-dependent M28 family amino/carboxypeptidase
MKTMKTFNEFTTGLSENFSLDNLKTLNEDNLEVKNSAKQIYSWLKKNGVNAKLVAQVPSQPTSKSVGTEISDSDNKALVMY